MKSGELDLHCRDVAFAAHNRGRIINMSSIATRDGGSPNSFAYAAAKGGVSAMAQELVSDGILVNAVAPEHTDTPFHNRFTFAEKREEKAKSIPMGREGSPEAVADAIVFMESPEANYIVGGVIEVNGGLLMD